MKVICSALFACLLSTRECIKICFPSAINSISNPSESLTQMIFKYVYNTTSSYITIFLTFTPFSFEKYLYYAICSQHMLQRVSRDTLAFTLSFQILFRISVFFKFISYYVIIPGNRKGIKVLNETEVDGRDKINALSH